MNALLCAGLLGGVSSIHAGDPEDIKTSSWMKKTGEIALKTSDVLGDFRMLLPIIFAANYMGYHSNMPKIISLLFNVSTVRLLMGTMTLNTERSWNAFSGFIVATLMELARGDSWTASFEDSMRSAAGIGLFVKTAGARVAGF